MLYSGLKKNAYNKIYNGLSAHEKEILISRSISVETTNEILKSLLDQSPEMFHVESFMLYKNSTAIIIIPKYIYTAEQKDIYLNECLKRVAAISSTLTNLSAYEKTLKIHDWVLKNVEYVDDSSKEAHNVIGPLVYGRSVCEGISKASKFILDLLKIPCIVVQGKSVRSFGRTENHAWNMVRFGQSWQHIDITFDLTIREKSQLRHDYFSLSTKEILIDHLYDRESYPEAENNSLSYYQMKNLVMRTKTNLRNYMNYCIEHCIYDFEFKIPDEVPAQRLENKVMAVISEELSKKGMTMNVQLYLNPARKVFQISLEPYISTCF